MTHTAEDLYFSPEKTKPLIISSKHKTNFRNSEIDLQRHIALFIWFIRSGDATDAIEIEAPM